jgi:hypothetical protein
MPGAFVMRLTTCRDCGQAVSRKAKACPSCGRPVRAPTSCLTWIVAGAAGVFFLGLLSSVERQPVHCPEPSSVADAAPQVAEIAEATETPVERPYGWWLDDTSEETKEGAIHAATVAVTALLDTPSTASFPSTWFSDDYKVFRGGRRGHVNVSAWVDAQNLYGAMVRHRWTVTLARTGPDYWTDWDLVQVDLK